MTTTAQLTTLTPVSGVRILGLSGKAGSGKTTLATYLVQKHGYVPVSLADHFKVDAVVRHGAPIEEVFGSWKSPETRKLLQITGTEMGRDVHGDDIWTRTAETLIYGMAQAGVTRVVVPDVRFENEVDWVRSLGGVIVRLTGRGGATGANAQHSSETALDAYESWDIVLDNTPGKEEAFWRDVHARFEE